jgi:ankyrin repeat protein
MKNGVDINEGDITKMTPLHYAVISMSLPVVKLLISGGADINLKNFDNVSPLDFAFKLNLTNISSYLKNEP